MLFQQWGDGVVKGFNIGMDWEGYVSMMFQFFWMVFNLDSEGIREELVVGEIGFQQDENIGVIYVFGSSIVVQ